MIRILAILTRTLAALCVAVGATNAHADVIERGGIRIDFPSSAGTLAEESMAAIEQAYRSYEKPFPKRPETLRVVICDTIAQFGEYAGPLSTHSVLGIAKPTQDLIVLKAPQLVPSGSDYRGTVRHEVIHVLLQQNVNTDNLPRWLNEGIAMVLSGENRWESRAQIASMYLNGRVLSYRELDLSFLDPGEEMQFGDAYAQAYSMTQYLMQEVGEDRFWAMLRTLDTQTFGAALESELGVIPYDFWASWKSSLGWYAAAYSIVSGFTLFQIMAGLTVWAYLRKRRRGLRVIKQWEEEENAGDEVRVDIVESYEDEDERD
ncbi:MAG: hypothetical protein IT366_15485 [Candidatus Hydrogenedentes bacterium]|nr:hypothetical protein [Candidatus Hydrogenedentota bacterium]